jgi:hypothetical protein
MVPWARPGPVDHPCNRTSRMPSAEPTCAFPVRALVVKALLARTAPGRRRLSRWSARSEARTNDLDGPEGRCRLAMGRLTAAWGRPAFPGCSTNVVSSATTIVIRVSPVGSAVASVLEGRPARGRRACAWRELTAVQTRDVGVGSPGRRLRLRSAGDAGDDVGVQVAQDVVAAAGELAGNGDRRQLAVVALLHRRVVGVIGAAGS